MFARVNPLGWAFLEILTSVQMNQIDVNLSRALDGLNGGAYTLAVMLELKGAGVKFSSVAEFNAASVNFVGATVDVDSGSTWTFNSTVLFNNLVAFTQGGIIPNLATLAIQSGGSLNNNAGGTIVNGGTLSNSGRIVNSGAGRIQRRFANLVDANATVTMADGDVFMMPVTALGARVYNLNAAGGEDSDECEFRQLEFHIGSVGHQVVLNGVDTITFGSQATPGSVKILSAKRIAGQWRGWTDRYA
jgi:hypothetical protein